MASERWVVVVQAVGQMLVDDWGPQDEESWFDAAPATWQYELRTGDTFSALESSSGEDLVLQVLSDSTGATHALPAVSSCYISKSCEVLIVQADCCSFQEREGAKYSGSLCPPCLHPAVHAWQMRGFWSNACIWLKLGSLQGA